MLEPTGRRPRFVADAMLGRLARRLRALGYDTLYSSQYDDPTLARLALAEDRILLTRDVELTRRRGLSFLLIEDDRLENQLRQMWNALGLTGENAFSRCLDCNTPLVECSPAQVRDRVPPYVYTTQSRFRCCPNCGRVYWRGTHWARMRAEIEELADSE